MWWVVGVGKVVVRVSGVTRVLCALCQVSRVQHGSEAVRSAVSGARTPSPTGHASARPARHRPAGQHPRPPLQPCSPRPFPSAPSKSTAMDTSQVYESPSPVTAHPAQPAREKNPFPTCIAAADIPEQQLHHHHLHPVLPAGRRRGPQH